MTAGIRFQGKELRVGHFVEYRPLGGGVPAVGAVCRFYNIATGKCSGNTYVRVALHALAPRKGGLRIMELRDSGEFATFNIDDVAWKLHAVPHWTNSALKVLLQVVPGKG